VDEDDISKLKKAQSTQTDDEIIDSLVDPDSERKLDYNRETGMNLLPSVKPSKMKQIDVNAENNTITVINKLK